MTVWQAGKTLVFVSNKLSQASVHILMGDTDTWVLDKAIFPVKKCQFKSQVHAFLVYEKTVYEKLHRSYVGKRLLQIKCLD